MSTKVLLADDSVTIQRVVRIILAEGDYDLQIADNGDAALTQALAKRPDIVLADVHMPGKNGYELCGAIKREPALAGVRVLLLSGSFEAFDEDKAAQAGADGSISKPFESQALIDRIEEVLAHAEATSESESVEPGIETAVEADSAEPDMWADLDSTEEAVEAPGSAAPYEDETAQAGEEVELEVEDLWDEDPLADSSEEQGAETTRSLVASEDKGFDDLEESLSADRATEGQAMAEPQAKTTEEEILFLDESDLLLEDDEDQIQAAQEESFEFIADDSAMMESQESTGEPAESVGNFVFEEAPKPAGNGSLLREEQDFAEEALETSADADLQKDVSTAEPVDHMQQQAVAVESVPFSEEEVTEAARGLSEAELTAIVEQVAGKVVERLATTVLERIAWEVVPDLAESLIREEISRITIESD